MSSTLKVDNITDAAGTGTPSFPNGLPAIGEGQTWQDVLASRSGDNTAYQNTTGRSIAVYIEDDANSTFSVSEDNSTWLDFSLVNAFQPLSVIIPPGVYYRWSAPSPLRWLELR